ncbi:glycosyltransferase [Bacillus sp. FJAT-45066]|uniref:glycosyltransferase n=1 Tax=Bacillus sp. FJAT-45066 TaxID=2011010 RepID=UPI0020D1F123|nr:glycosyltransferase family 2 protein [Bacillus sp. FJAT-45066]
MLLDSIVYIILSFLVFSLCFTIVNNFFLAKPNKLLKTDQNKPLISILIPMRNEERNVTNLIHYIKKLSYENYEVFLLDDRSTDNTRSLAIKAIDDDERFHLLDGVPLQEGWVGKVHACHQLSKQAKGKYLLFIDADVRLHPSSIEMTLPYFHSNNVKLVTGFPRFPVTSFLSKLLVPMQHFVVWTHLPAFIANLTIQPKATAAHGAFMMFEANGYTEIGGHSSVKNSLVEDVHIARKVKESGYFVKLINNTSFITCYMYDTNKEVWEGFLKNIYTGIGRSKIMVFFLSVYYTFVYILPFPIAIFNEGWLYTVPILFIFLQKAFIDWQTLQKKWLFILMPFSAIAFIIIMHASMWRSILKQDYMWKGRAYK